ncbi:hypothetical protein Q3G72_003123 [Acer saccharum]|nr:hypothetical protein Q3G72_003123 [Acer saccharum]
MCKIPPRVPSRKIRPSTTWEHEVGIASNRGSAYRALPRREIPSSAVAMASTASLGPAMPKRLHLDLHRLGSCYPGDALPGLHGPHVAFVKRLTPIQHCLLRA